MRSDTLRQITVGSVANCTPVIVHVDQSIAEARMRLRDSPDNVLFAVDGDVIVGVIAPRDIDRRAPGARETGAGETGSPASEPSDDIPVSEVMTHWLVFCRIDDSLARAAAIMVRNGVRRLAVMDDQDALAAVLQFDDIAAHCDAGMAARLAHRIDRLAARPHDFADGRRRRPRAGESPPGRLKVYREKPGL